MQIEMTAPVLEMAEKLGIEPAEYLWCNDLTREEEEEGLEFPEPFEGEAMRDAFEQHINQTNPPVIVNGIPYTPVQVLARCNEDGFVHYDREYDKWRKAMCDSGAVVVVVWRKEHANHYLASDINAWLRRAQGVLDARRRDNPDDARCDCGHPVDRRYARFGVCYACYADAQETKWEEEVNK